MVENNKRIPGEDVVLSIIPAVRQIQQPQTTQLVEARPERAQPIEDPLLRLDVSLDILRRYVKNQLTIPPEEEFNYKEFAERLTLGKDVNHFVTLVAAQALRERATLGNFLARISARSFESPNAMGEILKYYTTLDDPFMTSIPNTNGSVFHLVAYQSQCPGFRLVTSQVNLEYEAISLLGEKKFGEVKEKYGLKN